MSSHAERRRRSFARGVSTHRKNVPARAALRDDGGFKIGDAAPRAPVPVSAVPPVGNGSLDSHHSEAARTRHRAPAASLRHVEIEALDRAVLPRSDCPNGKKNPMTEITEDRKPLHQVWSRLESRYRQGSMPQRRPVRHPSSSSREPRFVELRRRERKGKNQCVR
jgi:hypothetical protein